MAWFDSSNFEAKCFDFCPIDERIFREKNGLLHRLEWIDLKKQSTDRLRAVKQFKRSSAGEDLLDPNSIRPTTVLRQTVDYLMNDVLRLSMKLSDKPSVRFAYYYEFTFDRLRSIRQDIVLQKAVDENCIYILERCIEFYINSQYSWIHFQSKDELKLLNQSFVPHINQTHLLESLNLLLTYYDHFNCKFWSRSRPLFEAIFLIVNLKTSDFSRVIRLKKSSMWIFEHRLMKVTSRIIHQTILCNYIQCLRLISQQSTRDPLFVNAFFISSLSFVHLNLLKLICVGFRWPKSTIPLEVLSGWFCPTDSKSNSMDYVEKLCSSLKLPIESPQIDCFSGDVPEASSGKRLLITAKFSFETWKPLDDISPIDWYPTTNQLGRFFSTN